MTEENKTECWLYDKVQFKRINYHWFYFQNLLEITESMRVTLNEPTSMNCSASPISWIFILSKHTHIFCKEFSEFEIITICTYLTKILDFWRNKPTKCNTDMMPTFQYFVILIKYISTYVHSLCKNQRIIEIMQNIASIHLIWTSGDICFMGHQTSSPYFHI